MSILTSTALEFSGMREEEGGVHSFAFVPLGKFRHVAGQHGLLKIPGAGTKAFSLASAPEDEEVLIGTRLQSGSRYKTALAALRPGQPAALRGPIMNFTLTGTHQEVVFLAQGVGITPFRSLLRHISAAALDKRATLIHVGNGHPFRRDTEPLAASAEYPADAETFRLEVKKAAAAQPGAAYFISGAGSFLGETASLLSELGISRKHIRKDRFLGY